jgi:hypothetical protein
MARPSAICYNAKLPAGLSQPVTMETVMSKPSLYLAMLLAAAAGAAMPPAARADVLLMQRVQQEQGRDLPSRGMTMAQVESRFGAPAARMDPRGGDSTVHPVINRWEYPGFIVYFEREHVIDTVMKRAEPNELGPKQAH